MIQPAAGLDPKAVRVITAIAYAPPQPEASQGHFLDLYVPAEGVRPTPLVIWLHGSGWMAENGRDGAEVVAAHLNPHGFAVAGVAIRSSEHAQFPAQLYDVKAAIRWLRAHAAEYHLDPAHFGIMGESSGGWTAAMAALTGDLPALEGDVGLLGPPSRVQAAVPFYPPTDFLQMDAHMLEDCIPFNQMAGLTQCHADPRSPESLLLGCPIADCPEVVQRANPVTYVSQAAPPFLIVHGQQDLLVPAHQSELLYAALNGMGAEVTLVLLPNGGHGQWSEYLVDPAVNLGAVARSSLWGRGEEARSVPLSWTTIIDFFEQHLRGEQP